MLRRRSGDLRGGGQGDAVFLGAVGGAGGTGQGLGEWKAGAWSGGRECRFVGGSLGGGRGAGRVVIVTVFAVVLRVPGRE